ncbi:hypothetical protein HDU80_007520 [Chytriomyces hyalinus]|nr:hypothetical protein HDU80_007520 [Chytriomyces hyalinus]
MPKQVRRKQQSKAREPSSESECPSESEPSQLSVQQQRGAKTSRARKPSEARTVTKRRNAAAKNPASKRQEASDSDIGDQASDEDNDDDDGTAERVQRKSVASSKARTGISGGGSGGSGGEGENYRVQLEQKIAMAHQFLDSFANDRRAEVEALSKSSEAFVRTQKKSISKLRQTQDETLTTVTTHVLSGYKVQTENAIQEMEAHAASVYKESQSLIKKDLGSGSKIKNAMEALLCV